MILIGELRDSETAETALQAAESGHLVLSTMHTLDTAETIGRMIEFFPAAKQPMIRSILASVLKGVVSQRLLPRVDGGRTAAVEVMVVNDRIAELIRENRSRRDPDRHARRRLLRHAARSSQSLIELAMSGAVEREIGRGRGSATAMTSCSRSGRPRSRRRRRGRRQRRRPTSGEQPAAALTVAEPTRPRRRRSRAR